MIQATATEVKYEWRPGTFHKVRAQAAGEEVRRIENLRGVVRPADVVEESRPEEAPLHPAFEWDDATAAERYREDQARGIIRSIRVVSDGDGDGDGGEGPSLRIAFVSVTREDGERGYGTTAEVMSHAELRGRVLSDAVAQLKGLRARYAELDELVEAFEAIDRL